MMKRIFLAALLPVIVLLSCNKEKTIFSKSTDQRIADTLSAYQTRLTGAQYGWIGIVYPAGGGAYGFYFSFNTSGRVNMFSDFDSTTSVTVRESSYRLESLQQPCLNFDTYSYIHLLADPDGTVNGGADGVGLKSDFEFAISDASTPDTIRLTGRFNGSKAILRKATQTEHDAYYAQGLEDSRKSLANLGSIVYYFKRLTTSAGQYDIYINLTSRTITFQWKDAGGNIQSFTTTWYYTPDGIALGQPFLDGSQTITGLTGISWNAGTATLNVIANGAAATIKGATAPLAVDPGAARAWYQTALSNGTYWYSFQGFHSNGVDNANRIDTVTAVDTLGNVLPYYYLLYYPAYGSNYDLFGPAFIAIDNTLTLAYGWADTYSVKTDGHGVFSAYGTLGTVPATGAAYLTQKQMVNANGYYFVNTGPLTCDMVSRTDTRIWINWVLAK